MSGPHSTEDRGVLRRALRRVAARLRVLHLLIAAAIGLSLTAALLLVQRLLNGPAVIAWVAVVLGAVTTYLVFRRTAVARSDRAAAATIEAAHPGCRNVVVTAEELSRTPQVEPFVRTRVLAAAERAVTEVQLASAVPRSRFAVPMAGAAVSAAAVVLLLLNPAGLRDTYEQIASALDGRTSAQGLDLTVIITPPDYTGRPAQKVRNPEKLEALEGSRLSFSSPAAGMRVRFGEVALADGNQHVVRSSGYFVVEAESRAERHLIPLTAAPDRRPTVLIENPGKDLFMAASERSIPITAVASDDHALRSLELRFTKVTGSGEQFEFEEGNLPASIERRSEREWRASGSLPLGALKLEPGDSLVYRAVSRDLRPGDAGLAWSDTYIVEILGPGQAVLEGVEMPPELERYGMSQQMIVLKLERIKAEEPRLARDSLVERLVSLAAEQRTVRANFIFLLGGHVEDEFEEAEHSHEIQEGRLENTARRDINVAIAHMTRAEQGMTAVDTGVALTSAREAVTALQRAFGRNRYLLRSLAVRSRLDPARRLTGDLGSAADWRRISKEAGHPADPGPRALLEAVLDMGQRWSSHSPPGVREIEAAAERLLALDPDDAASIRASQSLLELRGLRTSERAREIISGVAAHLAQLIERDTLPRTTAPGRSSPLRRAYKTGDRR